MHANSFLDHLAFLNLQPWSVAIIVPVVGMIFAGVIIVTTMYFGHRRQELWHQTARLALEKGQPLPSLPEDASPNRKNRPGDPSDDIRAGLILVATGVGLYLFLGSFVGRGLGYVGAIPGFIGIALLLFGLIRLFTTKSNLSDDQRPPQS